MIPPSNGSLLHLCYYNYYYSKELCINLLQNEKMNTPLLVIFYHLIVLKKSEFTSNDQTRSIKLFIMILRDTIKRKHLYNDAEV